MVYGDRDYRCNCTLRKGSCLFAKPLTHACVGIGAENVSLTVEYPQAAAFRASGYGNITTNATYTGGVIRQHGNFSFSRVFDAGHAVSAFQPETVYRIFMRAMFDTDVATGTVSTAGNANYSTRGPASSFGFKNVLPESAPPVCYLWALGVTCTDDQIQAVLNGTAIMEDYVVVSPPN